DGSPHRIQSGAIVTLLNRWKKSKILPEQTSNVHTLFSGFSFNRSSSSRGFTTYSIAFEQREGRKSDGEDAERKKKKENKGKKKKKKKNKNEHQVKERYETIKDSPGWQQQPSHKFKKETGRKTAFLANQVHSSERIVTTESRVSEDDGHSSHMRGGGGISQLS